MAGTKGNCYLCGAEISKGAIKNHIIKKHDGDGQECVLHAFSSLPFSNERP